ncbi:MAG: DUF1428 domain-containing protein [Gammaproteobacteria bacterium]|nr:DUF1428 domain-containing protein [Gammaproteobacteria bacterium]
MTYIDGFVIAVPNENKEKFVEHAELMDSIFMDHGALRIMECWEDDVKVGVNTDFRRAVDAKDNESIVFSWVEWPDKESREEAYRQMEELMKTDERFDETKFPVPFDGARMIYGGFAPVFSLP